MGSLGLTLGRISTGRMRIILASSLVVLVTAGPQGINFGGASGGKKEVSNRNTNNKHYGTSNSNSGNTDHCCCVPEGNSCYDNSNGGDDLVGEGFINERIVNRPGSGGNQHLTQTCPHRHQLCCYPDSYDFSVFGRTCVPPSTSGSSSGFTSGSSSSAAWRQGCSETSVYGSNQCGTRDYRRPASNLNYGEASPGEFPWTCLLLNQNNDFIGSCAIIPDDFSNNNNAPTRKVITATHKLKNLQQNDLLKVRVGEWDASGFNAPEQFNHEEYTVVRILKHPQFSPGRLSNDIALLYTDRDINLNTPNVNTACLPSCDNMFGYQFANGTGVRCWVAGWGKDEIDGRFQFKQKKVSLPLVEDSRCNSNLKVALNNQRQGTGNRFQLHSSEVCAGGEIGKDACTGDGGSPLVCQSDTGRWTVVGLVTWGVGCGSDTPGVYANVGYFRNWINAN